MRKGSTNSNVTEEFRLKQTGLLKATLFSEWNFDRPTGSLNGFMGGVVSL